MCVCVYTAVISLLCKIMDTLKKRWHSLFRRHIKAPVSSLSKRQQLQTLPTPKNTYYCIVFNPYPEGLSCPSLAPVSTDPLCYTITTIPNGWTFYHGPPNASPYCFSTNHTSFPLTFVSVDHVKPHIPFFILYNTTHLPTLVSLAISIVVQREIYLTLSLKTCLPNALYQQFPPITFVCLLCHCIHTPSYKK